MEDRIFVYSQETIKESKYRSYITMAMMPLIIIFFAFIFSSQKGNFDYKVMASIVAITITIIIIEIIIIDRILFIKLNEMKLIIGTNKFERIGGKFTEEINYENIKFIKVRRRANGKIIMLKVHSENKRINISGFEDMYTVLELIRKKIQDQSVITEKKYKVNWNSPMIAILTMALTVGILTVMIKTNLYFYQLFNMLFVFVLGLFFLLYKPISRSAGMRFRKFEIVLSIVLLASDVMMLTGIMIEKYRY